MNFVFFMGSIDKEPYIFIGVCEETYIAIYVSKYIAMAAWTGLVAAEFSLKRSTYTDTN